MTTGSEWDGRKGIWKGFWLAVWRGGGKKQLLAVRINQRMTRGSLLLRHSVWGKTCAGNSVGEPFPTTSDNNTCFKMFYQMSRQVISHLRCNLKVVRNVCSTNLPEAGSFLAVCRSQMVPGEFGDQTIHSALERKWRATQVKWICTLLLNFYLQWKVPEHFELLQYIRSHPVG